ncbi:hypothetical protein ANN_02835 [Periplaneta americana]|uniref:Uncharacterized protein n=1 Tax=Periplaneta americana TaxID=6978 RepID=A0ABQ8TYJ3_PERAM|nr:hypothetical protein ANN_02835 [Periplaneta americana]
MWMWRRTVRVKWTERIRNKIVFEKKSNRKSKELAYKTLVRPIMEYGTVGWDPYRQNQIDSIEKVQRKATKYVKMDYIKVNDIRSSEKTILSRLRTSHNLEGVTAMFAFLMIYSVLSIMLNVMLLIGAHTENLRLIFMWIIAHVIYLVVTVLGLLTNLFMTLLNPDQRAGSVGTSLVNIVLTFYFLVVVGSYYQQLKDRMLSTSPHAPHVVVYIENTRKPEESSPPPPYSELYPPWQQQQQQPVPK